MEKKLIYICEVCGKTETMTPEEVVERKQIINYPYKG